MSENIQQRPKLLIVSDTAVSIDNNGVIRAFEPVVREIEHFKDLFQEITWIASRFDSSGQGNRREVDNVKIKYILFDAVGGQGIKAKLKVLQMYFRITGTILKEIKKADVIHTRGPSHPAIIAAFFSLFVKNKIFWHKYAGNWIQTNPPYSYRLLKYILNINKHAKITLNGKWDNQKNNQLSFENPTLTEKERKEGKTVTDNKNFDGKLNFIFIGRIEAEKGVKRIIDALSSIDIDRLNKINFVGEGPEKNYYENYAKQKLKCNFEFTGNVSREKVNELLSLSHVLILPSDSEGFPKVIAEAANYGCIPLVSAVSSIPQYIIHKKTGFLVNITDDSSLSTVIAECLSSNDTTLKQISVDACKICDKFTYDYYNERIKRDILN